MQKINFTSGNLLLLMTFFIFKCYSQSDFPISHQEKNIGKNLQTNHTIIAKEIIFSDRIHDIYFDTTTQTATIQLRGTSSNGKWLNNKGAVIVYDLVNNKTKWAKKLNYANTSIEQNNGTIIQSKLSKSHSLDIENGNEKWEVKNAIYYVSPYYPIGIGYKLNTTKNILEGINTQNGEVVWQREVDRTYGWNSILTLEDSTILIVAAGLHNISLKNGKGWTYSTVTGRKDYTSTIAANVAGGILGVLTGTFIGTTGHDVVRDIVSNVIVDSAYIYFASQEKIAKLNRKGQVIWATPLSKDWVSKSDIFIQDSTIFMVNKGVAFMGYRQLDYGVPFLAAFDANTGKQIFLKPIEEKKNQINEAYKEKDALIVVFNNNKIAKYAKTNATLIKEQSVDVAKYGELKYFVGNHLYLNIEATYKNLFAIDSTVNYIAYTKTNKLLGLNQQLDIVRQFPYEELCIHYLQENNHSFLVNGNKTIVLNKDKQVIATLDISSRVRQVGNKLYYIGEKSLVEIVFKDIFEPK